MLPRRLRNVASVIPLSWSDVAGAVAYDQDSPSLYTCRCINSRKWVQMEMYHQSSEDLMHRGQMPSSSRERVGVREEVLFDAIVVASRNHSRHRQFRAHEHLEPRDNLVTRLQRSLRVKGSE